MNLFKKVKTSPKNESSQIDAIKHIKKLIRQSEFSSLSSDLYFQNEIINLCQEDGNFENLPLTLSNLLNTVINSCQIFFTMNENFDQMKILLIDENSEIIKEKVIWVHDVFLPFDRLQFEVIKEINEELNLVSIKKYLIFPL